MRIVAAPLIIATCLCAATMAQNGPPLASPVQIAPQVQTGPHRVRGTIVSFDGKTVTVKSDSGEAVAVSVLPTATFLYNEPRRVSDIHVGDFLGSAAVPGSDGKLHAQEVHLFPAPMRGTGEGQYPMGDPAANRSMT